MSANASSLLTLNPIIVYATLGLYGLLFAFTFVYLHSRFRASARVLGLIKTDWAAAASKHTGLVESAQDQISRLSVETPARAQVLTSVQPAVTTDTRNQIVAMARKGLPVTEIARSVGLSEGEVDVLLGLARMQR